MPPFSELIRHKTILAALAVVAVILVGSVAYYVVGSSQPALTYVAAAQGAIDEDVVGSGTVSPAENPDLAFTTGGRVTTVNAVVGSTVSAGTLLASIDTGVLSANYAAAEANYEGIAAGPRAVDLAGKQTAVASAQTSLDNAYETLALSISSTAGESQDAVHSTDTLFGSMNVVDYPRVRFTTREESSADNAGQERGQLQDSFDAWNSEVSGITASSSPDALIAAGQDSLQRLTLVNQFFTDLTAAVNGADPSLTSAQVAAVTAARASASGLRVSLTDAVQAIDTDTLALQTAKDALSLTEAGASDPAIAVAKAQADAARAALMQGEIIAPFDGTIAAVQVKEGDVVTANQPAVSIVPNAKFEVDVYLSEIDATKLNAGDATDVTLDAYGAGKVFAATVASVDTAPTVVNGAPAYKATLVFAEDDPEVKSGMHASATIHVGAKSDALLVPKAAVIEDATGTFVLKQTPQGSVKTPVTVGLVGTDEVEILSGLSAGDMVAATVGK